MNLMKYYTEIEKIRSQIDPLADKWNEAKKAGFDLNSDDKHMLLALLLKEWLLGTLTPGYEIK